jgi:hypothetical protein
MLNRPGFGTTAAIVAEVQDTRGWKNGKDEDGDKISKWSSPDVVLQFANCDRSIAFEIDWTTEAQRENALFKVDTMMDALRVFRKGLVEEQKRYVKRMEALNED